MPQRYEMNILVNGKRVKHFVHEGQVYVEGRVASKYEIELRNNTLSSVLAVVSVDGLSIMDGEPADPVQSNGYVIGPRENLVVPGWRLDNDNTAAFTFGGRGGTYADSKGGDAPRNIGIIGCAFFMEQRTSFLRTVLDFRTPVDYPPTEQRGAYYVHTIDPPYNPSSTGGLAQPSTTITCMNSSVGSDGSDLRFTETYSSSHLDVTRGQTKRRKKSKPLRGGERKVAGDPGTLNIGTDFGESVEHRVQSVEFTRRSTPEAILSITYSDRAGLKAMGIAVDGPSSRRYPKPSAWPGAPETGCEPPPGWNG